MWTYCDLIQRIHWTCGFEKLNDLIFCVFIVSIMYQANSNKFNKAYIFSKWNPFFSTSLWYWASLDAVHLASAAPVLGLFWNWTGPPLALLQSVQGQYCCTVSSQYKCQYGLVTSPFQTLTGPSLTHYKNTSGPVSNQLSPRIGPLLLFCIGPVRMPVFTP